MMIAALTKESTFPPSDIRAANARARAHLEQEAKSVVRKDYMTDLIEGPRTPPKRA